MCTSLLYSNSGRCLVFPHCVILVPSTWYHCSDTTTRSTNFKFEPRTPCTNVCHNSYNCCRFGNPSFSEWTLKDHRWRTCQDDVCEYVGIRYWILGFRWMTYLNFSTRILFSSRSVESSTSCHTHVTDEHQQNFRWMAHSHIIQLSHHL